MQSLWRGYVVRCRYLAECAAAMTIQSAWRCAAARAALRATRAAAVTMQSLWRGYVARRALLDRRRAAAALAAAAAAAAEKRAAGDVGQPVFTACVPLQQEQQPVQKQAFAALLQRAVQKQAFAAPVPEQQQAVASVLQPEKVADLQQQPQHVTASTMAQQQHPRHEQQWAFDALPVVHKAEATHEWSTRGSAQQRLWLEQQQRERKWQRQQQQRKRLLKQEQQQRQLRRQQEQKL